MWFRSLCWRRNQLWKSIFSRREISRQQSKRDCSVTIRMAAKVDKWSFIPRWRGEFGAGNIEREWRSLASWQLDWINLSRRTFSIVRRRELDDTRGGISNKQKHFVLVMNYRRMFLVVATQEMGVREQRLWFVLYVTGVMWCITRAHVPSNFFMDESGWISRIYTVEE